MNAVEIEEAVSTLAERPFEGAEFPFAFLQAFGNKTTTIKRLRSGASNSSDLEGVLQRSNIHIKVCPEGEAAATLETLKASPATARVKAKFVLATDGREFRAEDLNSGDVIVCDYPDFPEHFGFFLPLAGITTVKQIRESAFDIRATGRLNRLYVELLKGDPEWGTAARRPEMNHFMARLPATIAELYDPAKMPDNIRAAHRRNDEVLERIYIGRRFRNDTERLEKLFELYVDMCEAKGAA